MNKTLSQDLDWRGLIKDKTFKDNNWLDKPRAFYLGIDASADSLTVGNLGVILLARRLVDAGWKSFFIMGGGTSLIGDPGGKNEERDLMSRQQIIKNIEGIRAQVTKLFRGEHYTLVDNYDWLSKLKYVDFLREVGKHFSMTELMQRDFVVDRMGRGGTGLSYAEFSYSLVQGYDFWHLFNSYGVQLQIGGSDQWGNLITGVSLIRKKEAKVAHALSMPLIINRTTGIKFGKSEGGAVWLHAAKTSPHDFYQFWINVDDDSVGDYLKKFTLLGKEEVAAVMTAFRLDKASRFAQKTLAYEVTKIVHGKDAADQEKNQVDHHMFGTTHTAAVNMYIVDLLLETGLALSKTGARQLLASGGIYINDRQTNKAKLDKTDFVGGILKLRRGKTLQNTRIITLKK
jgi:tyrosyl-tRNA synthetase